VFGDGGAQTILFQAAVAAQMLKDKRMEWGFAGKALSPDSVNEGAVLTQVTDQGAYGLLSIKPV